MRGTCCREKVTGVGMWVYCSAKRLTVYSGHVLNDFGHDWVVLSMGGELAVGGLLLLNLFKPGLAFHPWGLGRAYGCFSGIRVEPFQRYPSGETESNFFGETRIAPDLQRDMSLSTGV